MAMAIVRHTVVAILALVFQLAQVLPLAAAAQTHCAAQSHSCSCCSGKSGCDCADKGEPSRKAPDPAVPLTDGGFKVQSAAVADPWIRIGVPATAPRHQVVQPSSGVSGIAGYPGVRFSVAFCSFVN